MSTNIAADRLYLLWCIEEQILLALNGTIGQEQALTNSLAMINESGPEMTADDDEKRHLQSERPVKDLGGLTQFLTPNQVDGRVLLEDFIKEGSRDLYKDWIDGSW